MKEASDQHQHAVAKRLGHENSNEGENPDDGGAIECPLHGGS